MLTENSRFRVSEIIQVGRKRALNNNLEGEDI